MDRRTFLLGTAGASLAGFLTGYASPGSPDNSKRVTNTRGHGHHPLPVNPGTAARSWPASFYTGPLGSSNILPTGTGAFLAHMSGGIGVTTTDARALSESRESAMGRLFDVYQEHYDGAWANTFNSAPGCEDPTSTDPIFGKAPGGVTHEEYCIARGVIPMVVWSTARTAAEILAGDAEPICQELGQYWAQYSPTKIMLRMQHEWNLSFDASSRRYAVCDGSFNPIVSTTDYIDAWQKLVTDIRAECDNVGFHWCPWEGAMTRSQVSTYYPGDAFVDWGGCDVYNFVDTQSTPLHAGWAEWWELANYGDDWADGWSYYDIFGDGSAVSGTKNFTGTVRTKPFFLGETGTPFDSVTTTRKGDWFRGVTQHAKGLADMPNCVGISFFDMNVQAVDYDWRVDSDAAVRNVTGSPNANALAGFVDMALSPLLDGR